MARKTRSSKKTVSIHLDAATLKKILLAIEGLSSLGEAIAMGADDPALRRQLTKRKATRAKRSRSR